MSLELGNGKKLLGQVASNKGYSDLIAASKGFTCLVAFFESGYTQDIAKCIKELNTLAQSAKQPDVATTATGLAKMMQGQDLVIVHNGLS